MIREAQMLNAMLGRIGLGQLDDPGLPSQLAFFVRDHDHFGQLLEKCAPEERRNMYEAMRHNLRFKPRTFDEYIAASRRIAEERQMPTVGADGKFQPFRPAEIKTRTDAEVIADAIVDGCAKGYLTLTCRKCTREEEFGGFSKTHAIQRAREAGWTYDELKGDGREICPDCPGGSKRLN